MDFAEGNARSQAIQERMRAKGWTKEAFQALVQAVCFLVEDVGADVAREFYEVHVDLSALALQDPGAFVRALADLVDAKTGRVRS